MKITRTLALAFVGLAAGIVHGRAEPGGGKKTTELRASLDAIVDWMRPFELTPENLEAAYASKGFKTSPVFSWSDDKTMARLGRHPYSNITVDLTLFGGKVPVEEAVITFKEGKAESIEIEMARQHASVAGDAMREILKEAPRGRVVSRAKGNSVTFSSWSSPEVLVVLSEGGGSGVIRMVKPADALRAFIHDAGDAFAIICDLDFLLDHPAAWQMSPEALDRRFDVADRGFKDPPFFKWLSAKKDRLRFARQPFSNITVDLRIFGGRVAVDEATVDFVDGRPTLVNISVYNRGDSGGMGPGEFDALFKACGQSLGQWLKVGPQRRSGAANQAVKTVGWMWQTPLCIAVLEHNEYGGAGKKVVAPEFLRIKLAPPGNRNWGLGGGGMLAAAVTRSSLSKNVVKAAGGDVYIKGVPMVDQGAKGYCVVASCQRLFEYYKIACDQHEMAQLAGTSADGGTSSLAMEATLGKIDSRFNTRFKPLISPSLRGERTYRPPDLKKFTESIKSHVAEGVPLLWALNLGIAREEPPLPPGGQMRGGHMRMIIGFNEAAGQIIFTDSWGAGHEMKRMSMSDGFAVTDALYVLQPRG